MKICLIFNQDRARKKTRILVVFPWSEGCPCLEPLKRQKSMAKQNLKKSTTTKPAIVRTNKRARVAKREKKKKTREIKKIDG